MLKKFAITGSAKNPNLQGQYPELSNCLRSLGMIESSIKDCEGLIFINYNKKSYKRYRKLGKNIDNMVLIRLEPAAVYPRQYQKSIEKKFKLIISPGRQINSSQKKSDFVGWPYKYNLNPAAPKQSDPQFSYAIKKAIEEGVFNFEVWNRKKDKIVLIAANKVSPTSKSNYKLRRIIAKRLYSKEIDIYGDLWKSNFTKKIYHRLAVCLYSLRSGYFPNLIELYGGLFTRYNTVVGITPDKHLVTREYKYSLVIENSPDYCSEKLFDAIVNGSIPIYIGPKNEKILLPNNLYHWSNGSIKEIRNFIDSINSKQANDMLKSMESYIRSESFKNFWISENVYTQISKSIYNFWNAR
jgi:hypothetical protein